MPVTRIFSSCRDLQSFLLEEAAPANLIIVPHQRLAYQLWHRQRLENLEAGTQAWEPLPCLTLGAWWQELCRHLWLPEAPASSLTRLIRWRRAMEAGPALEGVQPDLKWAKALDETYEILCRHLLPLTDPQSGDPPLVAWRRQVTQIFEALLEEEGLLPPARLPRRLLEALEQEAIRLPGKILTVGLEKPAPIEELWLKAVAARSEVHRLQVRGNPQGVREAYTLPGPEEEMEWVAARLVACHDRDKVPLHRLAVTSPAMDDYSPRFRRVLAELLGPAEQEGRWAYNFSAGPSLGETPLFAAAFLPLRFVSWGERREELVSLFLSPYFRALAEKQADVARWDRLFREQGISQGWERLKAAAVSEFRPDSRLLERLEQALAALAKGRQPLRDWLAGIKVSWERLGFPGELNETEALQYRRLLDLLDDLGQALDQEAVSGPELLEMLSHGAKEILLPGEGVQEAGIQIMGLLEMRGLSFDRVFCLGMNSGCLPASPRSLPLLNPKERSLVLGGTYASQHRFAADLYANLLGCAPHLTLTRPLEVHGEKQVGTPLYPGPWKEAPDWAPILSQPQPAWLLAPAVRAAFTTGGGDKRPDRETGCLCLPLPPELHVTHLQTALSCPSRFLFEVLLDLQDLPDIEAGLPPRERGNFLHQVLARFVQRFRRLLSESGSWQDHEALRILRDSAHELLGPRRDDPHWEAELERWLGQEELRPGLLPALLKLEKERYQEGWRWLAVELPFQGLTKAGWPFSLKGRIDRLDHHLETGEGVIWDYKSGEIPAGTAIFERLEEVQLLCYVAAVKQGLAETAMGLAGVRAGFIGLKSTREKHLRHQDFGKNAAHWEAALSAWEDLVAEVARRLQAGDFRPDPRPAPAKNRQGACEYCRYPLICGFRPEETSARASEEE
jgi:RecB family exonuclease